MIKRYCIRSECGKNRGQFMSLKKKETRAKAIAASKRCSEISSNVRLSSQSIQLPPVDGRRIVEFETFAKHLWCNECNEALSLRNVIEERKFGVASILSTRCHKCNKIHQVPTNKRDASHKLFDVNCKIAIGMTDAGLGECDINKFLSAVNIPAITPHLLKRYERIIMRGIEEEAEESFIEAIRLEKKLTLTKEAEEVTETNKNAIRIVCCPIMGLLYHPTCIISYYDFYNNNNVYEKEDNLSSISGNTRLIGTVDAAWFKRGTGFAYNSLEGYASLCGHYSGKVMGVATRSKSCKFCSEGHSKEDHRCCLDWKGSSKAMEPAMAVELVVDNPLLKKENAEIAVVVADNDSSTMAAIRDKSMNHIEKWSDFNHTKKSLSKGLYDCKISPAIRRYLTNAFSCAIKQNKGNAKAVEESILNVVPHTYGEHANCGEWCKGKILGSKYKHNWLPKGKPLSDPILREQLSTLFARYAKKAKTIAPCGSTQKNESFNSSATRKHQKSRCYAKSESHVARVKAAAAQVNRGSLYVIGVNNKLNLSPGSETMKYRAAIDRKRRIQSDKSKSIETKKRRLFFKEQRSQTAALSSRREGVTYETDCDLSNFITTYCNQSTLTDNISLANWSDAVIVYFDLETTDLSKTAEICQISARCNDSTFEQYTIPSKLISRQASDITGLKLRKSTSGNILYHNEIEVNALPSAEGLKSFLQFLNKLGQPIILAAHNCFRFDANIILRQMQKYELFRPFQLLVLGFIDTLVVFKAALPERVSEKKKFTLTSLVVDYLDPSIDFEAHNAVNDVEALVQLVTRIGCDVVKMKKSGKSLPEYLRSMPEAVKITSTTLQPITSSISSSMTTKIAKAGISLEILTDTYKIYGDNGIQMLFREDVRGKPRITNNKRIIDNVICNLKSLLSKNKN